MTGATATATATAADLASGKGHRDENFPVASRLIAPAHRAAILAFYRFARAADDIVDNPAAPPATKLERLEAMRATLAGASDAEPTAIALRGALAARGLERVHALDLLEAFRRDVTKLRYESWDELLDYCRVSAMPVGRFVLDVHGEPRTLWPANDALCAALQIINHLQDCGADYRTLDRVYLPEDMLAGAGTSVAALGEPHASPALLAVIRACAVRCQALLARSASFSGGIADRRLGLEVAVIQQLATSLATRLARRDPLSQRVHHSRPEAMLLAAGAVAARIARR